MVIDMTTLTVSRAKAGFTKIARRVIKTKTPVVVKTPTGMVQIVPYDLPEYVEPAAPDALKVTKAEVGLSNSFGDTV